MTEWDADRFARMLRDKGYNAEVMAMCTMFGYKVWVNDTHQGLLDIDDVQLFLGEQYLKGRKKGDGNEPSKVQGS